jgi:16S rRNA (cytosine1402-N4)-methyltransferase
MHLPILSSWQKNKMVKKEPIKPISGEYHETVLASEAVDALRVQAGSVYIDATLGNGGHSLEILHMGGKVLGIEMDPKMLAVAKKRFEDEGVSSGEWTLVRGNFKDIGQIAKSEKISGVSGILMDLGVTNIHLTDLTRGFSFGNPQTDLDMRLDPETQGVKASDLLNVLREDQLRNLFEVTLDPGPAKWIAGRVIHSRSASPIKTVADMLEICEGLKIGKPQLNEATLPFLALRIAVNSELENLKEALPAAYKLLKKGGRLVVISFHSKEDLIIKDFYRQKSLEGAKIITFKPVVASQEEVEKNRRSRSAKMRILEKI